MTAAFCITLIALSSAPAAEIPFDQRRSGAAFMSAGTRAMQNDDTANPGMLSVLDGEALWTSKAGVTKSCADCHGDAKQSMKGVAARYPAFDAASGRPIDLEQRINLCRSGAQNASPWRFESKELLALTTYVAHQSRGEPIADASKDQRLRPFLDNGRAQFNKRQGQLNLACSQCHDDNWGKSLAGNPVPQAHPTGYPIYRLEWQSMGSLQRRLRNCMLGMRMETYEYGAPEYVDLELYLMWRARGMPMETPAVRP